MKLRLQNDLEDAIKARNIKKFDYLVKNFDTFKQKDKNLLLERTVIICSDTKILQHVLDLGYDINYKNKDNDTLLHLAATSTHPATVHFLIKKGLDLEARNLSNQTPLLAAAEKSENPAVLQTLIEAGANTKAKCSDGKTLLICAASKNINPEITQFLLLQGIDTEERDDNGNTALMEAARNQMNVNVFEVLIDAGADVYARNKNGDTLFHIVAFNPRSYIAEYISSWFSTSDVNNDGITCFEYMLINGTNGLLEDNVNFYIKKMKEEHMMYAALNTHFELYEKGVLEALLESGYDPNTTDIKGKSVMMQAAKYNENTCNIEVLMKYHADCKAHDAKGRNVLHYAATNVSPDVYNWMMENDKFKELSSEKDSQDRLPEYYREVPEDFR